LRAHIESFEPSLRQRPGAALDTLKKLRILIRHTINIGWLKHDPSLGDQTPEDSTHPIMIPCQARGFARSSPSHHAYRTTPLPA
jgi:hypothetical protein